MNEQAIPQAQSTQRHLVVLVCRIPTENVCVQFSVHNENLEYDKFEDTKEIIRSRKSNKQLNDLKKKDKQLSTKRYTEN